MPDTAVRPLIPSGLRRRVRRLVDRLPPPRDEALRLMVRSTLDFARGRQTSRDTQTEARVVDLGWLLVDAYNRLGLAEAERIFGHELDAWRRYARSSIKDLERWEAGPAGLDIYENVNNRLRFRRTLDFVQRGERVFDVGVGRGYLCGVLLRDGGVAAYHGIDIEGRFLAATERMLAANGFQDRDVDLRLGDLFDLRQETITETGATLVICCEVLEHVADPEAALSALAEALPPNADLLFSVPLYGRLEAVWGHVTVFDVARLKEMVDRAQLHVHHVEPVANTWAMIVASRRPPPNDRVRTQRRRPPINTSTRLVEHYDFQRVNPTDMTAIKVAGEGECVAEVTAGSSLCQIKSTDSIDDSEHLVAGVTFPVAGLTALRVEIGLDEFDAVRAVHIDGLDGKRRIGRWTWAPTPRQLENRATRRFAVRPGQSTPFFKMDDFDTSTPPDAVRVVVEVPPGRVATFSLRAAYIPSRVAPTKL